MDRMWQELRALVNCDDPQRLQGSLRQLLAAAPGSGEAGPSAVMLGPESCAQPARPARRSRPPSRFLREESGQAATGSTSSGRRRRRSPTREPDGRGQGRNASRPATRSGGNPQLRPVAAEGEQSHRSSPRPQPPGKKTREGARASRPGEVPARGRGSSRGTQAGTVQRAASPGMPTKEKRGGRSRVRRTVRPLRRASLAQLLPPEERGEEEDRRCSTRRRVASATVGAAEDGRREDSGGARRSRVGALRQARDSPSDTSSEEDGQIQEEDQAADEQELRRPGEIPTYNVVFDDNVMPGCLVAEVGNVRRGSMSSVVSTGNVTVGGVREIPGIEGLVGGERGQFESFLGSMKQLIATYERGEGVQTAEAAWVPGQPKVSGGQSGGLTTVSVQTEKDAAVDFVHMDDRARGNVHTSYVGPLGAHLKKEVKEKIWRNEYVEIFSLLPLPKYILDKTKSLESKAGEEEKRRWRLIPQTFQNWVQAFYILASVIGEKAPEQCSALFCYVDSITEAYRSYGGQGWLKYDEQFRQRKAIKPEIGWDHQDVVLWVKCMTMLRAGKEAWGQSFPGGAGSSGQATKGGSGFGGTERKPGVCWRFNESQCKFGSSCKFKHNCSICGGASHGAAKCFRKDREKGGGGVGKGGVASESGGDAPLSR